MQRLLKLTLLLTTISIFGILFTVHAQDEESEAQISLFAEGLRNPVGLTALSDGTIFIAEEGTGDNDLSAGVTMRLPDGTMGRLVSGFPSSRDSGDLSGVALVGISPDESTLYIGNFAAGHLWTVDLTTIDTTILPETPFSPDELGVAMQALNRVMLTNPFDITFSVDGVPVVSDATQDGVARELANGTTQFFHRFASLQNPENTNLNISPVPTGIERIGEEYYVTLTGGCPFPRESGELVAIDESRNQRTVVDNLNMPIDVAVDSEGTIFVLEFARFSVDGSCFSGQGYLPNSGRLSRLHEDGTLQTIVENLNFPGAILPMPDGSIIISEIFDGELIRVHYDEVSDEQSFIVPEIALNPPDYAIIDDMDSALIAVIEANQLQAYYGMDLREGDTELAELGRDLFFDPILSGDMNISCATCHHPALAMADARVLPIGTGGIGLGIERDFLTHIRVSEEYIGDESGQVVVNPAIGQFVPRNSPTVLNSALLNFQFWDGRVQNYAFGENVLTLEPAITDLGLTDALAVQAFFPIISRGEMAGTTFGDDPPETIRLALVSRLQNNTNYADRFEDIFTTDDITPVQVVEAIAAFERQLIFTESPWDDYIAGDSTALSDEQKRGALLFYGVLNPGVNCSSCHSGDLLTDQGFYNLLVPQLGPGKGNGDNGREDWGRANTSFDWRDRFIFRTPSLRNVTLTAPYFHSGAYATLEATILHHANVWDSAANYDPSAHLPQSFYSSVRPFDPDSQGYTVAPELANGLALSDTDIADLVTFLESLTDPNALDLSHLTPESVPSGLELDPLPENTIAPALQEDDVSQQIAFSDEAQLIESDWHFIDATMDSGIDFEHGAFELGLYADPIAMMGAGLCWIDYDNDGWLDLYLVNSHAEDEFDYWLANGGLPENALYRNENGHFSRVDSNGTQLALRGNGCIAADFNLDGWYDLYITADGDDVLLLNQGDGSFSDITEQAGISAPEWNTSANVADINQDGLPDLFVGSYIDLDNKIPNPPGGFPQDYYGIPDRLYLNQGIAEDGTVTFLEVTQAVGLIREERTLGAIFTDADLDGDLDLYVANDGQPNRLYENIPDDSDYGFHFADLTHSAEVGDAGSGMGVTAADYDSDGMFDLFVTNWEAELNAFYRNETAEEGFINYRYSTYRIGMRGHGNDMTGWGTTWADFDHDTDIDLITVNGRVPVTNFATDPELVRFYGNRLFETGRADYFEWTEQLGFDVIGTLLARGSASADYDNDGDLDIAINTISGQAVLVQNTNPPGNWLQIQFTDFVPGTIVTIQLDDGRELMREWHVGSSYLASEDTRLHFGLGDNSEVDQLTVYYPDGNTISYEYILANQILQVQQP